MQSQLGIAAVCLLVLTGCTTLYSEVDGDEAARSDMEAQNLAAKVDRMQERLDGMDGERQDLYRRMDKMEADMQAVQRSTEDRVAAMERSIGASQSSRQRERDEIVETLSKKMAEISRPAGGGTRTATGVEHVVQPGETLSAIAAAYKTKPARIIEVNSIKDPNNLKVGQKLFIPE